MQDQLEAQMNGNFIPTTHPKLGISSKVLFISLDRRLVLGECMINFAATILKYFYNDVLKQRVQYGALTAPKSEN